MATITRGGASAASTGGFTAELPVDAGGLVSDYPGIARRLR
jgi:hypothetical protein